MPTSQVRAQLSFNADPLIISYGTQGLDVRKRPIVVQSTEIIRRRIDETGTKEASV